jgi:hypothetical protein
MPELIIMGMNGDSKKIDMTAKTTEQLMDIVKTTIKEQAKEKGAK